MSMPVLTYGCTACELAKWDAVTWGYRYYAVGKKQLRISVAMGWCHSCNSLAPIEKRPQMSAEQQLLAKQIALQGCICEMQQQRPKTRFWAFRRPKPVELVNAEYELGRLQAGLRQLRKLLSAMTNRQCAERCLECSSEDCFHLPAHSVDASFDVINHRPALLDCTHPGCGGVFTVCNDGTRLMVAGRSRAYDINGVPLGPWEAM